MRSLSFLSFVRQEGDWAFVHIRPSVRLGQDVTLGARYVGSVENKYNIGLVVLSIQ